MDVLFRAALRNTGEIYAPYTFFGPWTADEQALVEDVIKQHVPERVDSSFNNWSFQRLSNSCMAYQATWSMGNAMTAYTAEDLAAKIRDYYAPRQ